MSHTTPVSGKSRPTGEDGNWSEVLRFETVIKRTEPLLVSVLEVKRIPAKKSKAAKKKKIYYKGKEVKAKKKK